MKSYIVLKTVTKACSTDIAFGGSKVLLMPDTLSKARRCFENVVVSSLMDMLACRDTEIVFDGVDLNDKDAIKKAGLLDPQKVEELLTKWSERRYLTYSFYGKNAAELQTVIYQILEVDNSRDLQSQELITQRLITSPDAMKAIVYSDYRKHDEELTSANFNFNVKMRRKDILQAYQDIQGKINGDRVFRHDGLGCYLPLITPEDNEVFEGNCKQFLEEFNTNPKYVRLTALDECVSFIW